MSYFNAHNGTRYFHISLSVCMIFVVNDVFRPIVQKQITKRTWFRTMNARVDCGNICMTSYEYERWNMLSMCYNRKTTEEIVCQFCGHSILTTLMNMRSVIHIYEIINCVILMQCERASGQSNRQNGSIFPVCLL